MMMHSFHLPYRRKSIVWLWSVALIFWLCAPAATLMADGTNAAPVQPQPVSAPAGDFPQYLTDHQDDLSPYFSKHTDDFFKAGVPVIFGLLGWIMVFTVLIGWVVDVLMGRGYAAFFAPAFAKTMRAVIYATGRLVLSVVLTVIMGFIITLCLTLPNTWIVVAVVALVLGLVALAAQVWWVIYLYRTNLPISVLFYISVILAHSVAGILISGPIISARSHGIITDFVDKTVVPLLQGDLAATRQDLAKATETRDVIKTKFDEAQGQVNQAKIDQDKIINDIEDRKKSEVYIFQQIIKVHAQGDLNSARDQLKDFVVKFSSGTLIEQAKAQLTMVNAEIADQEAKRKQAEADAAHAAAVARADLLARAAKGDATLSDMRQALIGKKLEDVTSLIGPPTETDSNRWGYAPKMITNPATKEKFGLTVIFSEGLVSGVDYYYGQGAAK